MDVVAGVREQGLIEGLGSLGVFQEGADTRQGTGAEEPFGPDMEISEIVGCQAV